LGNTTLDRTLCRTRFVKDNAPVLKGYEMNEWNEMVPVVITLFQRVKERVS